MTLKWSIDQANGHITFGRLIPMAGGTYDIVVSGQTAGTTYTFYVMDETGEKCLARSAFANGAYTIAFTQEELRRNFEKRWHEIRTFHTVVSDGTNTIAEGDLAIQWNPVWTEPSTGAAYSMKGPKGDTGERGEKGDKGDPGTTSWNGITDKPSTFPPSSHTHQEIDSHIPNRNNPHAVTKEQVGLGNADNTSDVNKPVSTAQQAAIAAAVSFEASERQTSDAVLDAKIAQETSQRISVDQALAVSDASICASMSEVTKTLVVVQKATEDAKADFDSAIAAESTARQSADTAETTARTAADTALSNAIAAEGNARIAADSAEVVARNAAIDAKVAFENESLHKADELNSCSSAANAAAVAAASEAMIRLHNDCNPHALGNVTIDLANLDGAYVAIYRMAKAMGAKVVNNPIPVTGTPEIADTTRVYLGNPITSAVTPVEGRIAVRWYRGDIWGSYDSTPIATGKTYTPTSSDNEKWLKVVATDLYGNVCEAKVFCSTLPVVYVNTDDGLPIVDKTTDRAANLFAQGDASVAKQYNGAMEIHGRGNSSWAFPKQKPYKIKLDSKTNMYGYGKQKHWVLLSNFLDNTCLRNVYGSQLAKALGIVGMDMRQVTLVLNGQYQGVYLYGEHIRIDSNRVDIKDWEKVSEDEGHTAEDLSWIDDDMTQDVSGGYLWEFDEHNDHGEEAAFRTGDGMQIIFNRPECADTSTRMMAFCKGLWGDQENGVMGDLPTAYRSVDGYNGSHPLSDYLDIDAAAKYMLVNVILNNNDASAFSRYAYLGANEGDKVTFGPVWDFDYGGNSLPRPADGTGWIPLTGALPYRDWINLPHVVERMRAIYQSSARPWLAAKCAGGFASDKASLQTAAAANDAYRGYPAYGTSGNLRGFDADCTAFKTMLDARLAWLDAKFASLDTLMASLPHAGAHPYVMGANTTASFNGTAYVRSDEATVDFTNDVAVALSTTAANAAKMDVYIDGIKLGSTIESTSGTFTIPSASLSAGGRAIMSVVVRNGEGTMVERTFFCLNAAQ